MLKKLYSGNLLSHTPMDEIVLKRLTGLMMNVTHNFLTTRLIKLWKYPSRIIRVETLSLFLITEGLRSRRI
jgi:hypothetical protein